MQVQMAILYARPYEFEGKQGQTVQGVELTCVDGVILQEKDGRGWVPLRYTASADLFEQLPELPGMYEVELQIRPGYKGKPTPYIVGVPRCLGRAKIGVEQSARGAQG